MNEVAQALHDGLDRLRERGLAKDRFCDSETGRVCARGALIGATPENAKGRSWWHLFKGETIMRADALLGAVAKEQYPERADHWLDDAAATFNNHPDTTQEDVERVFEKAIVRAYEQVA